MTLTLVSEMDSELVGFAHSVVDEDAEWGTLLDNLHVRHDTRRLGIATQLMAETAARLQVRASGSPGLYLWVLENNAPARRFYDALGGRIVGRDISTEGGGSAPALRYSWHQLDALVSHLQGQEPETRRASVASVDRRASRSSEGGRLEESSQGEQHESS